MSVVDDPTMERIRKHAVCCHCAKSVVDHSKNFNVIVSHRLLPPKFGRLNRNALFVICDDCSGLLIDQPGPMEPTLAIDVREEFFVYHLTSRLRQTGFDVTI